MRTGVFPGSFDPLTIAHLAMAEAAVAALALDRLDLALSRVALAKEQGHHSTLDQRVAAIEQAAATRPWLGAVVTDHQLIVDIARGYDACLVGADKWHQLHDPAFYGGSAVARDAAMARLPPLAVALRAGVEAPPDDAGIVVIELEPHLAEVSSTAVRAGRVEWRSGGADPAR